MKTLIKDREALATRLAEMINIHMFSTAPGKMDNTSIEVILELISKDKFDNYNKIADEFLEYYPNIPELFWLNKWDRYYTHITSFIQDSTIFKYFLFKTETADEFFEEIKKSIRAARLINGHTNIYLHQYTWNKDREMYAQNFQNTQDLPRFIKIKNPDVLPDPYINLITEDDVLFRWNIHGTYFFFKNAEGGTLGIPWEFLKYTDWEWVQDAALPIVFGR